MILSLILLCLGFCASSMSSTYDQAQKQLDNINTSISNKDAISFTNYDIYSITELTSVPCFINYVDWVYRADGVDLYSISSTYTRGFSMNNNFWWAYSYDLTSSNLESPSVDLMHIQTMQFVAEPMVVNSVNSNYQIFTLNFYSTSDSEILFCIQFERIYNALLGGIYTWYTEGIYLINHGVFNYYQASLSLICKNPTNTDNGWSRQFFNFYGLSSDSTGASNYDAGFNAGYSSGFNVGYQSGYDDALNSEASVNPEMYTIFTGILNIGLLPVNVFLTILNFEVFGINIAGFVSSLLTISIVIIILRFIFGGKNND